MIGPSNGGMIIRASHCPIVVYIEDCRICNDNFSVANPTRYILFEGQKNKLGMMATMVIKSNFCLSY